MIAGFNPASPIKLVTKQIANFISDLITKKIIKGGSFMISIENVLENIESLKEISEEEIYNEIICSFEDYEFNENDEVIIANDEPDKIQIYINEVDAPIICAEVKEEKIIKDGWEENRITIVNAYIAY